MSFEMVMPFVVCESQGGVYDDDAYVAGFEAGRLDMALLLATPLLPGSEIKDPVPYHTANLPQLDLVAMRHGVTLIAEESEEPGWTYLTLEAS